MSEQQNPYFRTKPLATILEESKEKKEGLKRALNAVDLTAIGVGAMIGAGIFVLTGTAAKEAAGPAIMLSYVFAGISCILAALCYAEFASRLPISGSAYTYSYASVGELFAWIIGWDLVLEYTIGSSAVAVGWAEYLGQLVHLPDWLIHLPLQMPWGGDYHINALAGIMILCLTALLAIGIKESAQFNSFIVAVKVGVVLFVILAGLFFIDPANWHPFTPYGPNGTACPEGAFCWDGIFTGAALVFFSYIGFDAVSTAAEEVKDPQKNMPIGIMASLGICTLLYIAVAAVITGMVPYQEIDQGAPLAAAFGSVNLDWAKTLIGIGGVAGLTTVVLILLMSQPRIYFSMARDGLLPPWFARIHPKFRTPVNATILTGLIAATIAAFAPMEDLHHMVSIGTLFAFTMVSASTLILRYKQNKTDLKSTGYVIAIAIGLGLVSVGFMADNNPVQITLWLLGSLLVTMPTWKLLQIKTLNLPETFRCPWVPWVPITGMACMIFMMVQLSQAAWFRLGWWLVIGFLIYAFYGIWHSKLKRNE